MVHKQMENLCRHEGYTPRSQSIPVQTAFKTGSSGLKSQALLLVGYQRIDGLEPLGSSTSMDTGYFQNHWRPLWQLYRNQRDTKHRRHHCRARICVRSADFELPERLGLDVEGTGDSKSQP